MEINYTPDMLNELIICRDDPTYFIDNYCKINTADGLIPFDLRSYQRRMIDTFHNNRRVSTLTSRQMGKTVTTAAYILWFALFNNNKTSMICSVNYTNMLATLQMIRDMYETLPDWMRIEVRSCRKDGITFENGSRIIGRATNASAARGMSLNLLYIDEAAYVNEIALEEFYRAVMPAMAATNGKFIMTSSLKSKDDMFWKIRENAEENGFVTNTFTWRDDYNKTEEWRRTTIENIGYKSFYREYECEIHTINELYREIEQLRYELKQRS